MKIRTPVSEGCLVHLPEGEEGDIIVHLSPLAWWGLSNEARSVLSPYGTIRFIGDFKRTDVDWTDPSLEERRRKEFLLVMKSYIGGMVLLPAGAWVASLHEPTGRPIVLLGLFLVSAALLYSSLKGPHRNTRDTYTKVRKFGIL
jgi:hypothetical protein